MDMEVLSTQGINSAFVSAKWLGPEQSPRPGRLLLISLVCVRCRIVPTMGLAKLSAPVVHESGFFGAPRWSASESFPGGGDFPPANWGNFNRR
jgi:hypothetical protein